MLILVIPKVINLNQKKIKVEIDPIFLQNLRKKFKTNNSNENNLEINLQQVSDKKYLKLYKIDSNLVDYETSTLENTLI